MDFGVSEIVTRVQAARAEGDDKRAADMLRRGVQSLLKHGVAISDLERLVAEAHSIAATSKKGKARTDARWAIQMAEGITQRAAAGSRAAEAESRAAALAEYEPFLRLNSEHGRLLRACTVLGGYGHDLVTGDAYDLAMCPTGVVVTSRARFPSALKVTADQLLNVEVAGPGVISTGGGFFGGGFGPLGAAEGMAIASVLNRLTSRTRIETLIDVQWEGGQGIFHYAGETPDSLKIGLAALLGPLRERAVRTDVGASGRAENLADQLERLSALMDRGVLSPDEFHQAKSRMLADS